MILIRICSKSEKKLSEIASLLLSEKLIIDVNLKSNAQRLELINNRLTKSQLYVLTGKTKAVLFNSIDEILKKKYGERNMPELYSLAIVHMDWQQAANLKKETIG